MKKILSLAIASASILSLAACSVVERFPDENLLKSASHNISVRFTASNPDTDTKTAFGKFDETDSTYPTVWTSADRKIAMSLNLGDPVAASVTEISEDGRSADFQADFADGGAPYKFYALSPYSAVNAVSGSHKGWVVNIPSIQTPKSDGLSCDESAMLLYAGSEELEELPAESVNLRFHHVTTYCRLTLNNLSTALKNAKAANAKAKSVDITFSVPVAGEWYVNAADGSLECKEKSYTVTLKPASIDKTKPVELWVALAPCKLDNQKVTVAVNTDMGRLSREYSYGKRTYAAGAVNKLTLDMSKNATFDQQTTSAEETVFALVMSADDLKTGDEVIFADARTPEYAMTSTVTSNGIAATAQDSENGFIYNSGDGYIRLFDESDVMVMNVADKTSTTLSFSYGSKSLAPNTSSNKHHLTLSDEAFVFTSSISNGEAKLSYKSSSGKTTYSVCLTNGAFDIYSSSNNLIKTVAIYKKTNAETTVVVDPDSDPVLKQEQFGMYLKSGSTVHTPHVSQLSREYSGKSLTFAILFPAQDRVYEFGGISSSVKKGDSFTLNVRKFDGNKKTDVGTFEVTAIKEDGARIWLTDYNGNGFIIKR